MSTEPNIAFTTAAGTGSSPTFVAGGSAQANHEQKVIYYRKAREAQRQHAHQVHQAELAEAAHIEEMKRKEKELKEAAARKEAIEAAARIREADAPARRAEGERQKQKEQEVQRNEEKAQAEEKQKEEDKQKEMRKAQEEDKTAVNDYEKEKAIPLENKGREAVVEAEKQTKEINDVGKGDDDEWTVLPALVGGKVAPRSSGKDEIKPVETDKQRTARVLDCESLRTACLCPSCHLC